MKKELNSNTEESINEINDISVIELALLKNISGGIRAATDRCSREETWCQCTDICSLIGGGTIRF